MTALARSFLLIAFFAPLAVPASDAESQIKGVLDTQVTAWNRGDIPTFVKTYAPDCIFVGKEVAHGRAQLLARYEKTYPTRAAMGHLDFSALEVHLLTPEVALVTAKWQLTRTGAGGNSIGGVFSLVFHRQPEGWLIALDHTS